MVHNDTEETSINQFRHHELDTGSVEMQIIKLTQDIEQLSGHFKTNPKDHASKRGMVKMVSQRKKLLAYLQRTSPDQYKKIIEHLGIRK